MSEIRFLKQADMPEVTRLFQKIFRNSAQQPSDALSAYLQRLYIGFANEPEPASKVLINDNGDVTGFIGVNYYNYIHEGKPLKTAIAGALMVDNHEQDPLGGARLMRSLLDDHYDLI
ncbi:GNAT family N-acetyltransferase, partial [Pseudochrobactrum sp. sp1633]